MHACMHTCMMMMMMMIPGDYDKYGHNIISKLPRSNHHVFQWEWKKKISHHKQNNDFWLFLSLTTVVKNKWFDSSNNNDSGGGGGLRWKQNDIDNTQVGQVLVSCIYDKTNKFFLGFKCLLVSGCVVVWNKISCY